jgi:hypothetical protein
MFYDVDFSTTTERYFSCTFNTYKLQFLSLPDDKRCNQYNELFQKSSKDLVMERTLYLFKKYLHTPVGSSILHP